MRFNLLVGAVWRLVAFVLGAGMGGMALVVLAFLLPGIWLPISLTAVVALLMHSQDWLKKRRLATLVPLTLGLGVCSGWLASSGFTAREIDFTYLPALSLACLAALCFLALLVRTATLPAKQRAAAWWAVAVVVMAFLVSVGSSSEGSADTMKNWLVHIFGLSPDRADQIIPIIRKSIHFSFYGLVGWCARNAAVKAGERTGPALRFALALTLSLAAFDELRQSMVPNRTSSVIDVMIDMSGATVLVLLAEWAASLKRSGRKLST